jgi:hypothetical protein
MFFSDSLRRAANLIFAVAEIAVPALPPLLGIGNSIGGRSDALVTVPVQPAPYAFSIWSVIFTLSLAYAIYAALPAQKNNKILRRVGWWTAAAFAGNTLWMIIAQFVPLAWPTLPAIAFILAMSVGALLQISNTSWPPKERVLIWAPISMLAGWLTAATFVNLASVLQIVDLYQSIAILVLVAITAVLVLGRTRGNILYAATIMWALIAVFVGNSFSILGWTSLLLIPVIAGCSYAFQKK